MKFDDKCFYLKGEPSHSRRSHAWGKTNKYRSHNVVFCQFSANSVSWCGFLYKKQPKPIFLLYCIKLWPASIIKLWPASMRML